MHDIRNILAWVLPLPGALLANTISLKGGSSVSRLIVGQTRTTITTKTSQGTKVVPRSKVVSIKFGMPDADKAIQAARYTQQSMLLQYAMPQAVQNSLDAIENDLNNFSRFTGLLYVCNWIDAYFFTGAASAAVSNFQNSNIHFRATATGDSLRAEFK